MKKIAFLLVAGIAASILPAQAQRRSNPGNPALEQQIIQELQKKAGDRKFYHASLFGVKSNGLYDNTASFQKAVDYISENGGGTLYISVGRYLTGAVQLKDNVSIYIHGTVVGSPNIFDYKGHKAIFWAEDAENISISGGVIEGQGAAIRKQSEELKEKGLLNAGCPLPTLMYFRNCRKVSLKKVICRYPAAEELYITENSEADIEGCINDTK